jgi:phospholipid/cholesterol/gamma-HCH transport system ATP-binding protein
MIKTDLQKCLVGLMEPDEGEMLYEWKNFTTMEAVDRKLLRQQVGMLFQGNQRFSTA